MKRILLLSVLVVFIASMSFGQMAYNKGDQVINIGLGLGGFAGAYGGSSGIAITGGYEYGVTENISLGGVLGYSSSSDDYIDGTYKYTYFLIGARGAYHLDLFHNPKIDTYGGILLGYNIVSSSWTYNGGYGDIFGSYSPSASASYLEIGIFIGGRYYFDPHWAVQAELGYGLGILNIGIAYKL
ncbi:MAG: outer membrane beta-barrel protein [Bacteroidota bacterium]|jgi:hypothetical protein